MTHTPDPWFVDGKPGYAAPVVRNSRRLIARVLYDGGSEDPEVDDNAALIAAAPKLLEEGKKLANEVRGVLALLESHVAEVGWTNIACLQRRLDNFDAVTAKVEGERNECNECSGTGSVVVTSSPGLPEHGSIEQESCSKCNGEASQ